VQRKPATYHLCEGRWFAVSGKGYVAGFLLHAFAFCLVLLQYGVSEALYGVTGNEWSVTVSRRVNV